jgi:putative nucleotidyltransferase with HDIG domain
LQVANLAELAAERIGANALLTRVGALYHDIGKSMYPHFFVENQAEGVNPHDALNEPQRSAAIIIGHVIEGERLARKYRLPTALIDFISQHHGTLPVMYFYNKALEAADGDDSQVDKTAFSYPGPSPQTRETAILMLADTSESAVRAKRPRNRQEIENIIGEIIDSRVADGQLDHSHLTVDDLKIIREVFVSTLQGMFHPRIVYPTTVTAQVLDRSAARASAVSAKETHP